jgi:hypothetical protein
LAGCAGFSQALHPLSGFDVLPERVATTTPATPRHRRFPQRAANGASNTFDV